MPQARSKRKKTALPVPEILEAMASTYRERNAMYGDNFRMVGRVMKVLFPDGVRLRSAADYDVWHLFELKIVKLTRFAISNLTHLDSIHDDSVYGAMIEALLNERKLNAHVDQFIKERESHASKARARHRR